MIENIGTIEKEERKINIFLRVCLVEEVEKWNYRKWIYICFGCEEKKMIICGRPVHRLGLCPTRNWPIHFGSSISRLATNQ